MDLVRRNKKENTPKTEKNFDDIDFTVVTSWNDALKIDYMSASDARDHINYIVEETGLDTSDPNFSKDILDYVALFEGVIKPKVIKGKKVFFIE